MSSDYTYLEVTVSTVDVFTCTVADSGGTSGTEGAYIPALGGTVTQSSGNVSSTVISAPSAGNVQLISILLYAGNAETSPLPFTVPAGITNGAGTFGSKQGINVPTFAGITAAGTGNSGNFSALALSMNLGSNFNIISFTDAAAFSSAIFKLNFG